MVCGKYVLCYTTSDKWFFWPCWWMNSFWFLCQFGNGIQSPLFLVFFHLWDLSSILSWLVQIPNTVQFQVNIATSKCIFFYAGVMSLTIKICKFFKVSSNLNFFFFKSIVVIFIIAMHTCIYFLVQKTWRSAEAADI